MAQDAGTMAGMDTKIGNGSTSMAMCVAKMDDSMKMIDDALASGDSSKMKMALEKSKECMMMTKKDIMSMDMMKMGTPAGAPMVQPKM